MPSISTWYHNHYSTWNRTRRIQTSPFLASTETNTPRAAAAMAQSGAVVVNMATADNTNKKESKQLFGPDIGVLDNTPPWANTVGKNAAADSLSADVIKSWIAKSKEPSQPTTTLQALVNLKRPTLRLLPLTIAPGDDPDQADSHHHHGLEFEYDCDAPKCKIDVNVILPADHPLVENVDSRGFSRILVFHSVVDGGFGKFLKLEQDATLELGRFEQSVRPEGVASERSPADEQASEPAVSSPRNAHQRKRFTAFRFRKRSGDRAASGPALAVVDADAAHTSAESAKDKGPKDDMREGVRVTIRLSALDEDGVDVPTVNEQITYLHIVRVGAPPTADEEDVRPWVVKVIKREATIGPHTFHLHEIYGLTAQSSTPPHPHTSSPISTDAHTYPPTASPPSPGVVHEDEPSSECLLCLSSPREVILLPCRHLVACKECAVNMVEFGAGGNIVHNEDTNATANAGADAAAGEGGSGGANASGVAEVTNSPTVTPPNPRRKRKAKGWFCPVCRQPYTSLLRISTTPLTKDISDDENRGSTSIDDPENDPENENEHEHEGAEVNDGTGTPGLLPANSDPLLAPGGMMNTLRSGFRNLTLSSATRSESDTLPRDVERGLGSEAIAA
ncbi:hypothetical protein J3R83DRAFT_9867 [Lanmaoa asiatica]|nr:hypothetical protein J3R83DRAFT_9867 [Lanmaoa asiatica]